MAFYRAKIADIEDAEFQSLIDELYHCVGWKRDENQFPTLFYLIQGIGVQDTKALTAAHLPTNGVLTTKIDKLPEGVIYELCRELAGLKRTHIESFDGKSVLHLLKQFFPKITPKKKPTRRQLHRDAMTRVIVQRRANGDL